jgi:cytochrome c oxidase subunit 7c
MALARISNVVRRNFSTSLIRRAGYGEGPGSNMPFDINKKWRLLGIMTVFFGSGFAAPFILVRHQLKKK